MNFIRSQGHLLDIKNIELHRLLRTFRDNNLKQKKASQHIWFNSTCLKQHLVPKYVKNQIKIRNNNPLAERVYNRTVNYWLRLELKDWYKKRNHLFKINKIIYNELNTRLHPLELQTFMNDTLDNNIRRMVDFRNSQYNKIQHLRSLKQQEEIRKHPWLQNNITIREPHKFYKTFLNLSDMHLNNDEKSLLNKGLKYCLKDHQPTDKFKNNPLVNLAIDTDFYINTCRANDETVNNNTVQIQATSILQSTYNTNSSNSWRSSQINREKRTVENLRKKMLDNKVIATKADKGNTIVLMDLDLYDAKVSEFLDSDVFVRLDSDPTKSVLRDMNSTLHKCGQILSKNQIRRYSSINTSAPRFYGLPKVHKAGIPIRPVVSSINSPTYLTAMWLNTHIKKNITIPNNRSLTNTVDLVNKIKNTVVPLTAKLVSFDVKNLFTNVPVDQTVDIVAQLLLRKKELASVEIDQTIRLLDRVLKHNYFQTESGYYQQTEGLAMGSPLSPLMAEVFMNWFENHKIFRNNNCNFKQHILWWYRYVDDIICLWDGDDKSQDDFLNFLNRQHQTIQFTMERAEQQSINFLDVTIFVDKGGFEFSIFRKPTQTKCVIPSDSNHPMSHKLASFNSFIHRALSIPMSDLKRSHEITIIKQIAVANGYSPTVVDNILRRKAINNLNSLAAGALTPCEKKDWIVLDYLGSTSLKISKLFSHHNTKVAYRTLNSLYSRLPNPKLKSHILRRCGIYELHCRDCNQVYIGKTNRNFEIRLNEHERAFRLNHPEASHFARHLLESGHEEHILEEAKFLQITNNYVRCNMLETIEIRRAVKKDQQLLNEQTQFALSPLISFIVDLE